MRTECELDKVLLRDPLILPARECRQVLSVTDRNRFGDIVGLLVSRIHHRTQHLQRPRFERRGPRWQESLIDEHLRISGMVDDEKRDVVEEMGLPQFGCDANVVHTVTRPQLIAGNPDPVLRLRHPRRVLRVDAQTEWRPPEEVGHEVHVRAVPRKHPRARSFEPLLGDDHVVDTSAKLGLCDAVRPHDASDVDAGSCAETEVHRRPGHDLRLHREPGTHADLAADAK